MYNYNKLNHTLHGNPHPQYGDKQYKFKNVDGVNTILKLMQIDFVYDGNTGSISDLSGVRKMRLSMDVYNTSTSANQFLGDVSFSAWVTAEENSSIPFGGQFRMKMASNFNLQSDTVISRNGFPCIIYGFVEKLDFIDASGISKYRLRVYGSTNVYDNLVIVPKKLYVDMPLYKDYFLNNNQYAMSNIATNMMEKMDSVINPYLNNPGVSLNDVYTNIPNAVVFTSDHISNPMTRTTIHDHSKLTTNDHYLNLDNSSDVLVLRNLSATPYAISQFISSDTYYGARLTVVAEAAVNLTSIPTYTINGQPYAIYLKNGASRAINKGDVLSFVFLNNIWIEINGGGTNL